ncbi:MAG: preprotein translocase subunit SecA [Parcubacteria group bacterium CG1_02_42_13]|nr:MAG: preprotein translocase subunit SecA [Parcubacteria group bacterium CG1_02_42_13]
MSLSDLLGKFFAPNSSHPQEIDEITSIETTVKDLSDEALKGESKSLKELAEKGTELDELLPKAFALIREASKRTLGQRHYDVQLWGGIVLHRGQIAEMITGEGKTLAATAPIYLNSLSGKGVHVITVNDYLAKRDTVWMGQIYNFLGLSVACLVHDGAYIYDPNWHISKEGEVLIDKERDTTGAFLVQEEFLRPVSRREAYLADITYGTNHEFGFDYLRDNLAQDLTHQVQRELNFAIIDEVDSILIDEARTPLIISVADRESSEFYRTFARAVDRLKEGEDYTIDEKLRSVEITEAGINKIEAMTSVKNIYATENLRLVHYLEASLKAKALFLKDKDYVVRDGEVIIVDQFTGRLMPGRRWSLGIHQAVEAKEDIKGQNVRVEDETRTMAQITLQNYFRLYKKIAGMTGTAQTSAEEFHKVYGLEVVSIAPNKPLVRNNLPDTIYKTPDAKYRAVAKETKRRNEAGQPVLIGTVSIEKNEILSKYLKEEGVRHEILNAKNHEREGAIIAQAGRWSGVTLATNMAGRGVDIILGGNPPDLKDGEKVRNLGGLHVIGTERHEARRIDNQLRGRAGRQGDPGSSQFFLSLDDDLLRIFGGDGIKRLMERFNLPEDMPIENKMVSRAVAQAQSKIEGFNFDARKHLLDYDDVLNKQRLNFYGRRQRILTVANKEELRGLIEEILTSYTDSLEKAEIPSEDLAKIMKEAGIEAQNIEEVRRVVHERIQKYENFNVAKRQILAVLDFLWMNHLEDIEDLVESVRLRAYGQKDPLVEYRRESKILFDAMMNHFEAWVFNNIFKIEKIKEESPSAAPAPRSVEFKDVGRNDPCPCGSGKKFKKCHGK